MNEIASEALWALHVRGPDDTLAMPDYATAVAFADWLTAVDRGNIDEEDCPIFAAVPALWHRDAASHAADIKQRVEAPWAQREYPIDVPRAGSIFELTEIAREHPLCKLGKRARERLT